MPTLFERIRDILDRIRPGGAPPVPERTMGPPASRNGASSFHLWWRGLPAGRSYTEVSAVLQIVGPPGGTRKYFWALQASFVEGATRTGAGHLGLQYDHNHPGSGAVNWGGYHAGGGELDGTDSPLPGARPTRNTRDYRWQTGRRYRLRISPTPGRPGWWRGEVTDLTDGVTTLVRDLHGGGGALTSPVVWSEVFADCDARPVTVRWSELSAKLADGNTVRPNRLLVSYQSFDRGGCTNTNVQPSAGAVNQLTNVPRTVPHDAEVPI